MSRLNHSFRQRAVINFTQVTNNVLQNKNLSFKAKGLYSFIQSYLLIPNFNLTKSFLMSNCLEGEKAFDSAWKELKDNGFLKQYRIPNPEERGKFIYEYELLIEADISTPGLINCDIKGNPVFKEKEKETEKDHIPQNGGDGENDRPYTPKRTLCSKDAMLNGGDINNTILNNNNINNNNISSSNEDEEDDNLNKIMKYCQSVDYKLTKAKAKALLVSYDYTKIIKAIAHIIASDVKVTNYSGYLSKTLADLNSTKVVNINTTVENKRGFNNFKGREVNLKEYDELEKKLLGWD